MSDVSLRQLEYLVAVAEHGTLAGAADAVHVSPGTMSASLTALERSLGMQLLLRRSAKGSALTPAGSHAVRNARRVLAELEHLRHLGAQVAGEVFGQLRVGCYTTISPWLLPRLADRFRSSYPAARLEFDDTPRLDMTAAVAQGELDAAITFQRHIESDQVWRKPLARSRMLAMFPAEHELAREKAVTLAQLAELPAVVLDVSPRLDLVSQAMLAAGLEHRTGMRSRQFQTVCSLVARGFGYSLTMGIPHFERSTEGLPLTHVPITGPTLDNPIELVLPRDTRRSAAVLALIREAEDICRELEDSAPGGQSDG